VKGVVLSRGRSHVPKDMARGTIGTAAGRSSVEACPVLPAREVWEASSLVRAKGIRTGACQRSRVELRPSLVVKHRRLSGDVPDAHLGRWPNKPLQGHRAAIVAVACLRAGKPRG
jgi:hypothetical protein